MQITTQVTTEQTVEIELPLFFKHRDRTEYLGVLNEQTVIKILETNGYKSISNGGSSIYTSEIKEAHNKWSKISEQEFLAAHALFLRSLSLKPKLHEIDREIEKELGRDDIIDLGVFGK